MALDLIGRGRVVHDENVDLGFAVGELVLEQKSSGVGVVTGFEDATD